VANLGKSTLEADESLYTCTIQCFVEFFNSLKAAHQKMYGMIFRSTDPCEGSTMDLPKCCQHRRCLPEIDQIVSSARCSATDLRDRQDTRTIRLSGSRLRVVVDGECYGRTNKGQSCYILSDEIEGLLARRMG
jgi:hypothetical protein